MSYAIGIAVSGSGIAQEEELNHHKFTDYKFLLNVFLCECAIHIKLTTQNLESTATNMAELGRIKNIKNVYYFKTSSAQDAW